MAFADDLPGINDPQDAAFRGDFLALLHGSTFGTQALSDAELARAIQASTFYGKLGSGSNPYAAAFEVAAKAGLPVVFDPAANQWWNSRAVDRSPEGVARAQDKGGSGLGTVLTLGGIALGGYGLLSLATEAAGAAAIGGEALGSEFGVQGDLAGVLTSSGGADITIGSEFGVQGDLAGTLATSTTGASSVASNALSASQVLKGASDAASVANGVLKLAGTAATLQGVRNATANPIDFTKLTPSTPTPLVFSAAPDAPGAAEAGSSSIGALSWQTIGLVLILIVAVLHGG